MRKWLVLLVIVSCAQINPPVTSKYNRKEWRHWSDDDGNCLNTRAEILKERSEIPVKMNKKGCTVISGLWHDYYYPEVYYNAKAVDIDHLVSLKNAHASGGSLWTTKVKETFANDPQNLVITNRSYNRKKGAKGIDQWLPVDKKYACKYAKDWYQIKKKYSLKVTTTEQSTLADLRSIGCITF